jgi:hypothetical protein
VPYREGILMRQMQPLVRARQYGVTAITTLIGLYVFYQEAKRILKLPFNLANYEYLALLGVTGALVFLWIWASQAELEMLGKRLDPKGYATPSSIRETAIILVLAGFLVALFLAASDIRWYAMLFLVYLIVDVLSLRYAHREIRQAVDASYARLRENGNASANVFAEALEQIEFYYFSRPHNLRRIVVFVAMCVVATLAFLGKGDRSNLFTTLAYGVSVVTIIASEVAIGYWRQVRDNGLRAVEAKLSEVGRGTNGSAVV